MDKKILTIQTLLWIVGLSIPLFIIINFVCIAIFVSCKNDCETIRLITWMIFWTHFIRVFWWMILYTILDEINEMKSNDKSLSVEEKC
jgi:hypothetical protein